MLNIYFRSKLKFGIEYCKQQQFEKDFNLFCKMQTHLELIFALETVYEVMDNHVILISIINTTTISIISCMDCGAKIKESY